jgi:Asp-tRNA(Asn)/Glu-tRNA(Gln) amidotransferase A subunit family amidase
MQEQEAAEVTAAMVQQAAAISGLEVTDEQAEAMAEGATRNLRGYSALRDFNLDNSVAPPLHFNPLVPGMRVDREVRAFRTTSAAGVRRPQDLEEAAFWPLTELAELLRTRQVTSVQLTEMYLSRLERYNPKLNCVVTLTPELALSEARRADSEIAQGRYRGLLHGIPWGAKDIIAVKDYPTTWGSPPFRDRITEHEASVVRLLREAGAVLVAKLATGELASGDRWYGGRTRNPWNSEYGSSGSSAGPASATVAGLVGFAIGTETSGSILSPSVACGATGLRPTFGRVSRFGAMTLRWTGDRLGPLCRTVEDCAVVFQAIARIDEQDPGVLDIPFNWDAGRVRRDLRLAYLAGTFDADESKGADWTAADHRSLEHLRSLGYSPTEIPTPMMDFALDALRPLGVESAAAFEGFLREGRDAEMARPQRGAGWRTGFTVPAVQYLQAQRVRGIMMSRLHEALGDHDVYVVPYGDARWYVKDIERPNTGGDRRRRTATSQFFQLANHAGYPAVAVRHGWGDDGLPMGITFVGRPFHEAEVLALAKAYQDSTDFHLRRPELDV